MRNGEYNLVIPPIDYPGFLYRDKYAYEHHVVWWKNKGEIVPKGYVIHHLNHIKTDNDIINLQILTASEHVSLHNKEAEQTKLICSYCSCEFIRPSAIINFKKNSGQTRFYCCRSHQVIHQQSLIKKSPEEISAIRKKAAATRKLRDQDCFIKMGRKIRNK